MDLDKASRGSESEADKIKLQTVAEAQSVAVRCRGFTLPQMGETSEVLRKYADWQIKICDKLRKGDFEDAKSDFGNPPADWKTVEETLKTVSENAKREIVQVNSVIFDAVVYFTGSFTPPPGHSPEPKE